MLADWCLQQQAHNQVLPRWLRYQSDVCVKSNGQKYGLLCGSQEGPVDTSLLMSYVRPLICMSYQAYGCEY